MPILMIALIALMAFGAIGMLLATAVILETRSQRRSSGPLSPPATSPRRRAA